MSALVPVRPRPGGRAVLTGLLVLAAGATVAVAAGEPFAASGGTSAVGSLLASLGHWDLAPSYLAVVAQAAVVTAAYAVAGMSVALALGLPGAVLLSGVLVRRPAARRVTVVGGRAVAATLRGLHELVWALLLLTVLGLTPLAGVLAIGLPYAATVARVVGDRLVDVPRAPLAALALTGAGAGQVLAFGRVPLAAADVTAYLAYRLECAVRSAAVLSFIGLGGIGLQVQVALDDLAFDRVWPLLAALVLLVLAVDAVSRAIRRRLLG